MLDDELPPEEDDCGTKGFDELPPVPLVRSRLKLPKESCCEMSAEVLLAWQNLLEVYRVELEGLQTELQVKGETATP